jgi:hypothetical protein
MMVELSLLIMRGTTPAPIVPEMPTSRDTDTETHVASDGGARRQLPERTFGAPLVPDCS